MQKEITLEDIISRDKSSLAALLPIECIEQEEFAGLSFLTVGQRDLNFPTEDEGRNERIIDRSLNRIVKSIDVYRQKALEESSDKNTRSMSSLSLQAVKGYIDEGFNGFIINQCLEEQLTLLLNHPTVIAKDVILSIFSNEDIYANEEGEVRYLWSEDILGLAKLEINGHENKLGTVAVTKDSLVVNLENNSIDFRFSFLPCLEKGNSITLVKIIEPTL